MKTQLNNKKGFTVIETLVAVAIIMVVIAGPLASSYRGLATASASRDQLTAAYLAQDALEYIRYVRDTNIVQGYSYDRYLDGNPGCDNPTLGCIVDTTDSTINSAIAPATSSNNCIFIDNATGLYKQDKNSNGCTQNGTTKTNFNRYVVVSAVTGRSLGSIPQEKAIRVTVSWQNGKSSGTYLLTSNIIGE